MENKSLPLFVLSLDKYNNMTNAYLRCQIGKTDKFYTLALELKDKTIIQFRLNDILPYIK